MVRNDTVGVQRDGFCIVFYSLLAFLVPEGNIPWLQVELGITHCMLETFLNFLYLLSDSLGGAGIRLSGNCMWLRARGRMQRSLKEDVIHGEAVQS